MLLRAVGSCCAEFETGQTFEAYNTEHFFCSVIFEAERNNIGMQPVCTQAHLILNYDKQVFI